MYYKLLSQYKLCGWKKLPYAIVDTDKTKIGFMSSNEMEVLKLCDGLFDFNLPLFIDNYKEILNAALENGLIKECKKGEKILPEQKYKYYDNRFIRQVHWSITGRCNYKCKHCYMSAPDAKMGQLPLEDIADIINQLAECGVYTVSLTGGEPLIRKDFMEIVDMLLDKNIKIKTIYSNGLLVKEDLLKNLVRRNIHPEFNMSFDGTENWHDWLRGVDCATENIIKAFELCKKYGFPTGAEMCIHEKNKHTLRDSVNFLARLGCNHLKTVPIEDTGSWKDNGFGQSISIKDLYNVYLDYIPYYFKDNMPISIQLGGFFQASPKTKRYSIPCVKKSCDLKTTCICGHARHVMYISPEGRCLPCMPLSSTEIQNNYPLIKDIGLKKCITDSSYMSLIETTADVVINHNKKCKNCKFATQCIGGCRASGLLGSSKDILAKDEATCKIFLDGYIDKIHVAVSKNINNDVKYIYDD